MRAMEDLRAQVRSNRSRDYVDEAIAAYTAAAYRAAVISIWIAVVSDLIDKIDILAENGEPAAVSMRETLRRAIDNSDKSAMQKFESAILEEAKTQLHILSEQDFEDLARLRHDRNLCAHPAYVSDETLFSPSAERVRAHLATAVDTLLSHGPVVGRKAIARFDHYVRGKTFPVDGDMLRKYIAETYIDRGTKPFISNLCKVVCKTTMERDTDLEVRLRYTRVAIALYDLKPADFEDAVKQVLHSRMNAFDEDDSLFLLAGGICRVPCTWRNLQDSVGDRIVTLLENASVKELVNEHQLYGPMPSGPIDDVLLTRLREVLLRKSPAFTMQVEAYPDPRILEEVKVYVKDATDYYDGEAAIAGAIAMVPIMSPGDLHQILDFAAKNDQVCGSVLANRQLSILRLQTKALGDEYGAEWDVYDNR